MACPRTGCLRWAAFSRRRRSWNACGGAAWTEPFGVPRRRYTTVEDRPPHEAQLVARAKRGDLDAYEDIVRQHGTIAFRTAWVITRSAADAEEAAQDAFVKAHAALGCCRRSTASPMGPARRSPAAICWSSRRRRPPPRSAAAAAP